jgi:excinuclease ABC subunit C
VVRRPPAGTIPDAPGSYQFADADGRVIYVGKAKSLRSRLSSYFQNPASLAPRTAQMVAAAETVTWVEVRNELEALMLEYSLIKAHQPRFNIRLRDDKSYPLLAVTVSDEWPRAMVMRGTRSKGVRYFGPYASAHAIRQTLDLLLRTFPVRTCSDAKLRRHERLGKPCLLYHIEKCAGPCVGAVTPEDYQRLVDDLIGFLDGDTQPVVDRLTREMEAAAAELDFEQAARLRDRIESVGKVVERQQMVVDRDDDLDVIGMAGDDLESAVQVLYVRRGRVVGHKGFVVDNVEELDEAGTVARVVGELYADDPPQGVPREVLVPSEPADHDVLEAFLAERRGSRVRIRVPQRGDKRALADLVGHNAADEFARHRLRRASDHNSRARALNELQQALGLATAPLRIECFDMSHLGGTDYVGSMVVLEDGAPRPPEYRRFKVRTVEGSDDVAAMGEVLTRRFEAYLRDRALPPDERGRFAYPPQLLLVDGGLPQLGAAVRVLDELGLTDDIPVAALAKRFEEVYRPGSSEPLRIARGSEALYLLQRVRDEAHRFAITYHRTLRGKRMTRSALDDIPGLGPARRKRLVAAFGGVNAVKAASRADFDSLSWLPVSVADNVWSALHPDDAGSESGNAIAGGRDEGSSSDGSGGDGVGGDAAGRNGGRVT